MSPESLLAEKLNAAYRGAFDDAVSRPVRERRGRDARIRRTIDDDDAAVEHSSAAAAASEGAFENRTTVRSRPPRPSHGSPGVRFIAEDFAHEFNAKLAAARAAIPPSSSSPTSTRWGRSTSTSWRSCSRSRSAPLMAKLDAGDIEGARRAHASTPGPRSSGAFAASGRPISS